MLLKRTKPYLIILILIALAVNPAFATGEGNRNLILIGVMGLSPIIILSFPRFDRINPWLVAFMLSIIIIPLMNQPQSMRWSTVLYSIMFCLTFIVYQELLHLSYFTPKRYLKVLKYLILAYFVVLVIQQLCVLTGLPVFNLSNYNPTEPWKLNSLAAEPSHSARIVGILMYCYITTKELVIRRKYNLKIDINKDKWVWFAFIWTMVTMGSSLAFLFLTIILLKFIRFRNLFPIFVLVGFIFLLVNFFGITAIDRTYQTAMATLTLDTSFIIEADHSASIRIVPFIILAKMASLNSWDGWFGHGVDYVSTFLSDVVPGVPEGFSGGGVLSIWIEYGFISFALFVVFSLSNCYGKRNYLSIIFWFLLVGLSSLNNSMMWLTLVLFLTKSFFENKYNNIIVRNE
jgi:hypothetical protein